MRKSVRFHKIVVSLQNFRFCESINLHLTTIFNLNLKLMRKHIAGRMFVAALLCSISSWASQPADYYQSCEGLCGKSLLVELSDVVGPHTVVSYNGLWSLYQTSDTYSNGKIWDMYSTKQWTYKSEQCGTYSVVGDCYNREHSFPKSWFDDASPMVSDAFHIYPTDGKVNGQRSNYPYGECSGGTTLPSSGGIKALGRLGSCTFAGYSGKVFEPDDEYKGDFARSYFYMAAAYNSRISSWSSPMLAGNNYPCFSSWAVNLLLKWHRQDPVSQKELDRNEAVYAKQKNRNPFIDHPELAEHIWGNKSTVAWYEGGEATPEIVQPVNGTTLDLGTTVTNIARSASISVRGIALTDNVTITTTGTGFSATPATLSAAAANNGATVQVTFLPAAEGTYSGKIVIKSGALQTTVNLKGKAIATLPAGPVTSVDDHSFMATWSYVGDADANGEYTLDVQLNGESLDAFPTSVRAADEAFYVEDLEPSTTYTYTIASAHLVSEPVSVTTLDPIPNIEFYFDGKLSFTSMVGEPSEAAELLVLIENIDENINLAVQSPFQLSTDKADWNTSLVLDPEADRVYLRMMGDNPGTFTSSLVATVGDLVFDQVEFEGTILAEVAFYEDFENEGEGSYSTKQYTGSAGVWNIVDGGFWPSSDKVHGGSQALRMGKSGKAEIALANGYASGFGNISFWAAVYGSDADATLEVEYCNESTDNEWHSAGTATINSKTYSQFTFRINAAGPAKIRLRQTAGKRFMLDDIEGTPYSSLVPDNVADYHRWDAFCRDGQLVIEAIDTIDARVIALDGIEVWAGTVNACGTVALDLTPGLYITVVDDVARRVLIK